MPNERFTKGHGYLDNMTLFFNRNSILILKDSHTTSFFCNFSKLQNFLKNGFADLIKKNFALSKKLRRKLNGPHS